VNVPGGWAWGEGKGQGTGGAAASAVYELIFSRPEYYFRGIDRDLGIGNGDTTLKRLEVSAEWR